MVEFTHKCENGGRIAIKNIDENKGAGWFNHWIHEQIWIAIGLFKGNCNGFDQQHMPWQTKKSGEGRTKLKVSNQQNKGILITPSNNYIL